MDLITSRNNDRIVQTAKLSEKKYRDASRLFIAEGTKLYNEAVSSGAEICDTFVSESFLRSHPDFKTQGRVFTVSDGVYAKLSTESAPEGIMCTVGYMYRTALPESGKVSLPCFILCSVRDPGNVGTAIRSSYALGIKTLILSPDCADVYNPKTVRGSMGAVFKQKIYISEDIKKDICKLRENGICVTAAVLDEKALSLPELAPDEKICFAVGNEGRGLPSEIVELCPKTVYIPMGPGAESLNASAAASILMWEQYKNGR